MNIKYKQGGVIYSKALMFHCSWELNINTINILKKESMVFLFPHLHLPNIKVEEDSKSKESNFFAIISSHQPSIFPTSLWSTLRSFFRHLWFAFNHDNHLFCIFYLCFSADTPHRTSFRRTKLFRLVIWVQNRRLKSKLSRYWKEL